MSLTGTLPTLAEISSRFIGDFSLDEAVHQSLESLGKLTTADRSYIYRLHHKAKLAHITHEYIPPDKKKIPSARPSFSISEYPWFFKRLNTGKTIDIPDPAKLPSEASREQSDFEARGIRSALIYPLFLKGKLEGFIGFERLHDAVQRKTQDPGVIKIAVDIIAFSMERKQSEKSLRRTEELYRRIFENTGAATVSMKADTRIVMVNTEFERLTGRNRKEVEGKLRLVDFIAEKDQSILRKYHHLLMTNPQAVPSKYEFEYLNRKEEIRHAFMTGSTLLDQRHTMMSFIDITEFKKTEQELTTARDRAEESDRLKSAFMANVSHEIRTPLNAITGFSALLANPNLHLDKKEKYIKQILNGSNELVNLIDNVLDISRIESGTLQARISEFLLNQQLEETLDFYEEFKIKHARENLDISLKLPEESEKLLVRTDQMRLQQILGNLLENAVKYTSSGHIEFGYSRMRESAEKEQLLFFVRDTGIGIAKKDREKIFERFVKVADREAQLYRGAGLGLALAKDLTQLLGGEIWVESTLGKGSSFYFSIPFEASPSTDADTSEDGQGSVDWSSSTILVAEDTESNYLYIEEILSPTGVKLLRAGDGLEAVELFRANKEKIDLVFMDILMPEYDGFESTQLIRKIRKDVPVIAQTAFTFEGEMKNGLYAGCFNDYILKPFDIKVIKEILGRYLYVEEKNHPGRVREQEG